jgi:hypothetical protein
MVNRMLWNGVPYKSIVDALHVAGFSATERNISNWATGGFLDWRAQQEIILQNRLDQDFLIDRLRRHDATELPEVGLQAAATLLCRLLLDKIAAANALEDNLPRLSQIVDLLSRLTREIHILQKQRDDAHRALGKAHDPARIRNMEETEAIEHEHAFTNPIPSSRRLEAPEPPVLPSSPASVRLAEQDRDEDKLKKLQSEIDYWNTLRLLYGQSPSTASAPKPPTPPPAQTSPDTETPAQEAPPPAKPSQ